MKRSWIGPPLAAALWLLAPTPGAFAGAEGDETAIRRLLTRLFDKPEARLAVDPVIVEGDAAIADWAQGELGGRAFLRRKEQGWEVALCAGDALKESAALEKLGLTRPRAERLAASLAAAERRVEPERLKRMSLFDGVVAVDAAGNHLGADPHHRPIP